MSLVVNIPSIPDDAPANVRQWADDLKARLETMFEEIAEALNGPPYIVGMMLNRAPSTSETVGHHTFTNAVRFLINLAGSKGKANTAATAQTDFDVLKNGVSIGTIRFAAAATTPTFIVASAVGFAIGDTITVVAPVVPDATLANFDFALKGTR